MNEYSFETKGRSPQAIRSCGRRNGLICLTSMLNKRIGQFYEVVYCKVMRQLKTEARVLKNIDDLTLKQNMYRYILAFFGI